MKVIVNGEPSDEVYRKVYDIILKAALKNFHAAATKEGITLEEYLNRLDEKNNLDSKQ